MQKPVYSVDFETVVDPNETRVWLWGKCDIDCTTFVYGTDIDSFMEEISTVDCKAYFHNIKFDVQFMFYWLFHNGYRHTSERKPKEGYFSTLISDMGMFYTCTVHFFNGSVVEFIDSYKLITLPVRTFQKLSDWTFINWTWTMPKTGISTMYPQRKKYHTLRQTLRLWQRA